MIFDRYGRTFEVRDRFDGGYYGLYWRMHSPVTLDWLGWNGPYRTTQTIDSALAHAARTSRSYEDDLQDDD